ncbi:adenosylcobinamide-GDP ribazoletransferase [Propionimicrobium sp. PCR01-08-3]|uniref:adenosylcobinamide-GDP ribazoletransferase n=1 Tax=Propionimicrobium sp. PCR01-08-3 TaxID=3052086 RepID=UPI00255CD970|nr:adenosylcobinamide-GDP ribazoletransferase [Propionimicrobium sp. PCR01-08-3]WIY81750.1 adenosylcobinamide-GDP ribazoletransferase [Propionimicrobium sp. PCR01-08-3]
MPLDSSEASGIPGAPTQTIPPVDSRARKPFGLALAAGFFSIIPMPALTEIGTDETRRALRWFPSLGALFGLIAGLVGAGALWLTGSHVFGAVLVVLIWQVLTGAMHLDGLADCFDGLAALGSRKDGRDAARAMEIMHTPDTGAMGVATIVLVLLTQVGALSAASSPDELLTLAILAPVAGRTAILVASRPGVPPARKGGFGALFHEITPVLQIVLQVLLVAVIAAALGWWTTGWAGAAALIVSLVIALGASMIWVRRLVGTFRGLSGDMFGAIIEVTTAVMSVAGALALSGAVLIK